MIEKVEEIHNSGYVHLDIKPDNILLETDNLSSHSSSRLILIDLGLAEPYHDKSGKHLRQRTTNQFKGNLDFASKHAFEGRT